MKMLKKILLNIIIPLMVVIAGFLIFKKMKDSKQAPKKVKIESRIPLVKTQTFAPVEENIKVKESGTLYYPDEVTLIPRVSGQIVKLSKQFFLGGFIKKGEVIAVLDQSDYRLNLEVAEAEVLNRKTLLEKEEEEAKVARMEWELYKKRNPNAKASPLRLRIPQVNTAKAALKSVEANVKKAKLNLSRTYIRAPFDAKVKSKLVSKGQYVTVNSKLGVLQSIEKAYVKLYLKNSDLAVLPDFFKEKKKALVQLKFSGKTIEKEAEVIAWASELEPKTKMLEALVEVKNPYENLNEPMISGSYVEVELEGKKRGNMFRVPESLVHNDVIYLYKDGLLWVKKVDTIKQYGQELLIEGLKKGDRVITTSVVDVIHKMKVTLEE